MVGARNPGWVGKKTATGRRNGGVARIGFFVVSREGKCRAEHEQSREQPNPDHWKYPVTSLDRS
jgi:hypothetical protein